MDGSNFILCLCPSKVDKWFSHHRQLQMWHFTEWYGWWPMGVENRMFCLVGIAFFYNEKGDDLDDLSLLCNL
jgi:hypothetical protein